MIYRHDLTSELPVSALRLRQLIQDPEQLLKLSTDVREIRQNEAGDWECESRHEGTCMRCVLTL